MPDLLDAVVQQKLATLEGLISERVGLRLAALAATVPAHLAIVELGSYKGKSTCYLAAGAQRGFKAPVYAIDPWDLAGNPGGRFGFDQMATKQAFVQQVTMMDLNTVITPIREFSARAAKNWRAPVGLLYVDGSHTEHDVLSDWRCWSPFLQPGAVVAFDDYDTPRNPGVKKVVDRLQRIPESRWVLGPEPLMVGFMKT